MDAAGDSQIRAGRWPFIAMAGTYTLGALNDNFYKAAVVLFCNAAGRGHTAGWVPYLMALPYLLFAAHAGWLADRFSKRRVVIVAKALELAAMLIAAVGLWTGDWRLIMSMVFLMGAQSAMFSPALNGSIPELYPSWYVAKANGRLKAAIVGAVLLGTGAAAVVMGIGPGASSPGVLSMGRRVAGVFVVAAAAVGLVASFWVVRCRAADPQAKLPWSGPVRTLQDLVRCHRDGLLAKIIWANAFVWGLGSVQLLIILQIGQSQLKLGEMGAGLLAVMEMVGVAVGGLIGGRLASRSRWFRALPLLAGAIGVAALGVGQVPSLPGPWQVPVLWTLLFLAGTAGGMFIVPCESFIQVRPAAGEKGAVISVGNFAVFAAICLTGVLHVVLSPHVPPTALFAALALVSLPVAVLLTAGLWPSAPAEALNALLRSGVRALLWLRYRVGVRGLDVVAARGRRGVLLLPNHTALIDPIILAAFLHRTFAPKFLADQDQVGRPVVSWLAGRIGVVRIPDIATYGPGAAEAVTQAVSHLGRLLADGENVLLYPGGRLCRTDREDLCGNSAVQTLLRTAPDARIVLIRHRGLWGSGFSWAAGRVPRVAPVLRKGIVGLLASGICFAPRRKVEIELVEPDDVPRSADRETLNTYLEAFYNAVPQPRGFVPYSLWRRGRSGPAAAAGIDDADRSAVNAPPATRKIVVEHLRELTGQPEIRDDLNLGRDLGMDSLARVELLAWVQQQFGAGGGDSDSLLTVADVLRAACGAGGSIVQRELTPPVRRWFVPRGDTGRLQLAEGRTLSEIFFNQARSGPARAAAADQRSGTLTYRRLAVGVSILTRQVQRLAGPYVGVMLPASVAADVTYLAVLQAGKTPVMLNWTAGPRNLSAIADQLDIRHVVTASALLSRLAGTGVSLGDITDRCVPLEQMRSEVTLRQKLSAVAGPFAIASDAPSDPSAVAAVLTTSGSETLPKAVPLTHGNIVSNLRDVLAAVELRATDRMLGILPPFHAFGLTATVCAPLLAGMPVVHHGDPTEGGVLAGLIELYGATILIATPTFLAGILRAAAPEQLDTLRLVVTGAEACPPAVSEQMARRCSGATVLEGYGLTECSPIVTLNDPRAPQTGTIGKLLPSLEHVIVNEAGTTVVPAGQRGVLLVRGPSVFGGYLGDVRQPFVDFGRRQWFRTGDVVSQSPEGVLTFHGRLKRFVKIGGEMVSLPAVEAALAEIVPDGSADEGPSLAVVADETSGGRPELVLFTSLNVDRLRANEQIRRAGLSTLHSILRVVHLAELPVLGTGKTDYRQLQTRLKRQT